MSLLGHLVHNTDSERWKGERVARSGEKRLRIGTEETTRRQCSSFSPRLIRIDSKRLPTHGLSVGKAGGECIEYERTNRCHATAALTEYMLRNARLCDHRPLRPMCTSVCTAILPWRHAQGTFCRSSSLVFQY